MGKRSNFRHPMPVYVATLATGEVVRISYGSPVGHPLDIARGRYCAAYQCGTEAESPVHVLYPKVCDRYDYDEADFPDDRPAGDFCPVTSDTMSPVFVAARGSWAPLPPKILAEIVSGEVEYEGETYADPMTAEATIWPEGETPKKTRAGAGDAARALRAAIHEAGHLRAALHDIVTFGTLDEPLSPAALARIAAAGLAKAAGEPAAAAIARLRLAA